MIQSGYFIIGTNVALHMMITVANILHIMVFLGTSGENKLIKESAMSGKCLDVPTKRSWIVVALQV